MWVKIFVILDNNFQIYHKKPQQKQLNCIASKLKPFVLHSLQENEKTNNGKIVANHILDKGLVSRIFKELLLNLI